MARVFEFEVELLDIQPRIWRRFQLNANSSFETLHHAIQDSFGWKRRHLYEFRYINETKSRPSICRIARCREAVILDNEVVPFADELKVASIFAKNNDRCVYFYDFGDGWNHIVHLKGIVECHERFARKLINGAMACPPEDCGGAPGYQQMLEYLGMTDEQVAKLDEAERPEVEWLRKKYRGWMPKSFDLASTRVSFDF